MRKVFRPRAWKGGFVSSEHSQSLVASWRDVRRNGVLREAKWVGGSEFQIHYEDEETPYGQIGGQARKLVGPSVESHTDGLVGFCASLPTPLIYEGRKK